MLVALWVRVRLPENRTINLIPAATVPKAFTVVVPVTVTKSPVAAARFTVDAEAISAPIARIFLTADWIA
jgi:hypothetical protein